MRDWADFCESQDLDPNNPDEFDDWLSSMDCEKPARRPASGLVLDERELMNAWAGPECVPCRRTGYIGRYKHIAGGRCFTCLPDRRWFSLLQELELANHLASLA